MVVVLNMLIAIMGHTFDEVYGKQQLHSMKTKLHFVSEIEKFFLRRYDKSTYDYLYVITPYDRNREQGGDSEA